MENDMCMAFSGCICIGSFCISSSCLSWVHMIISLLMHFCSDWTEIRFFFSTLAVVKRRARKVSLSSDTSLLDLTVILTISLSKLLSKGNWFYKIWKKNQENIAETPFSPIKVDFFFFPSSPSFPSPAASQYLKESNKTCFVALYEGWVWIFRMRLSRMVKIKEFFGAYALSVSCILNSTLLQLSSPDKICIVNIIWHRF